MQPLCGVAKAAHPHLAAFYTGRRKDRYVSPNETARRPPRTGDYPKGSGSWAFPVARSPKWLRITRMSPYAVASSD
jgi:hypothetical protein